MGSKRKALKRVLLLIQKYWFLITWTVFSCFVFYNTYRQYKGRPEYHYLRSILGIGLCISRGSATVLNINCCLVLVPVCRGFNALLCRAINAACGKRILLFWLQNVKTFHLTIGVTIMSSSAIHTAAHIQNAINFSRHYDEEHKTINWAKYRYENPFKMVLNSLTGTTGLAMMVIIVVLTISSTSSVRRTHYNIFWYTHHTCYLFLLVFLIHPLSGVLKEQVNTSSHKPGCVLVNVTNQATCKEGAIFQPIQSQGWLWIILPLSIYLTDYLIRLIRRNSAVTCVVDVQRFPDGVALTIAIPNPHFKAKPGQFILMQCPDISKLEWHPFSITNCPTSSQPFFQILVRARGDWSTKLQNLPFNCEKASYHWPPKRLVRLQVDGPYNSPMEGVIKSRITICVAAGVGITPFMSSIRYLLINNTKLPNKVHLVWIAKQIHHIDWSVQLLLAFHNKCWNKNEPDRFSFNIYITGTKFSAGVPTRDETDVLTKRLNFGRPNWNHIFGQWSSYYPTEKCNVFTCGPKSLTSQIRKITNNYPNFYYIHESFS